MLENNNKYIDNYSLIFDLDGTLINTDEVNFLAYKEAINEVKKTDATFSYKNNDRFTREKLYSTISDLKLQEYENIIEIKNEVYSKYLHKSEVNSLVLNIIKELSQTNKIILATNAHKYRANMILEYHGLMNFFDHMFYKEDYNIKSKFEHILNNLNINPCLTIVFENDSNEIKKAIFSGIPHKHIIKIYG